MVFIGHAFSHLVSFNNMSLSAGCPKFYSVFHCFSVYVILIIHFCLITIISALIVIFSADEIKLLLQIVYVPEALHQFFIFFHQLFLYFSSYLVKLTSISFYKWNPTWLHNLKYCKVVIIICTLCIFCTKPRLCCSGMVGNES